AFLTESRDPLPYGGSWFDSQLGFAVRAVCPPLLDLAPHASPDEYLARRAELGPAEVTRRLLRSTGITDYLVDTGIESDTDPGNGTGLQNVTGLEKGTGPGNGIGLENGTDLEKGTGLETGVGGAAGHPGGGEWRGMRGAGLLRPPDIAAASGGRAYEV